MTGAFYVIEGSNNNSDWVQLAVFSGGAFGNRTDTLSLSGTFRYVRMFGTARSAGNQWDCSICEMEVLGN
ncbi:MAG: hypothetical protein COA42_22015 [Alteromonadaceae bacterium]|nr:MAG: hypothetical protein COA42_22015 [Alteromonadaceae bacterium]